MGCLLNLAPIPQPFRFAMNMECLKAMQAQLPPKTVLVCPTPWMCCLLIGNATLTSNSTASNATTNGTLYLRLTPSGATSASGTNLIDNIQIQSN
jgi:hypothetical protein